jgi:Uma2 family endonuclease
MEERTMGRPVAESLRKLTYEDFLLFPDDGKRHELIDGEHLVTPSPNLRHQWISRNLFRVLDSHVTTHDLGRVFYAPLDVLLSDVDVVEPDLLFVSRERSSLLGRANVQGPPDLVVEIVSPSHRRQDEVLKRDLYDRAGVVEYWLVDPEAETVKVFQRDGHRYGRAQLLSLRDGDALASPQLAGLTIPLAVVFAE